MRKIGTITTSLGFIFLGIWMIINKSNPTLGKEIFRWWPALIIILGIEILLSYNYRNVSDKIGFNFLVILILLLFIGLNLFQAIQDKIGDGFKWFNNNSTSINKMINALDDIDLSRLKGIDSKKTLNVRGSKIALLVNNGDVRIKKSTDNNIKIEATIYVNKENEINSYDIKTKDSNDGYQTEINESYIKKAKINIYIPEGYNVTIDGDNLKVSNENDLLNSSVEVKGDNGSIDLYKLKWLKVNLDNGSVKTNDIKDVNIESNNGSFKVNGETENIKIKSDNGAVTIDNKNCKNVDISLNTGAVKVYTDNKNLSINADMDHGTIDVNGTKRLNSSYSTTTGTGENKISVKLDNGVIIVKN